MDKGGANNDAVAETGAGRVAGEVSPEVRDWSTLVEEDEEVGNGIGRVDDHQDLDGPDVPHDGRETEVEATDGKAEEPASC